MVPRYNPIIETFRASIFDTIPDPLLVLDEELYVLTANRAFYEHFETTPEETREMSVFDIGNKRWDIPELRTLLQQILPERTVIEQFEVSHTFPQIGHRTLLVNAREIFDRALLPLNIILITLTDVTDRRRWTESLLQINDRLKAANADLETFGHLISHDLRAPLRIIRQFSDILLSDFQQDFNQEAGDYLDRINHNVKIMEHMIAGLSQLAGIGRQTLIRVPVDLSEIAEQVIATLRTTEPNRPVEIDIKRNSVDSVDVSMITNALSNLLSNAWKFTKGRYPARISFSYQWQNGRRIYMVSDNGIGFDMQYAERVFEIYQRLPSTHEDEQYEGSGIGLAIVKNVITRHGGQVWAESVQGKGTTIYFTVQPEPQ